MGRYMAALDARMLLTTAESKKARRSMEIGMSEIDITKRSMREWISIADFWSKAYEKSLKWDKSVKDKIFIDWCLYVRDR